MLLRRSRGSLATFGAFAAVIIYGGIMNPAAATVIFILIAAEPMLEKLDRIKVKYGLVEYQRKN